MATRVGRLTRERRRELTRTALIEAAADLFARRGYHATSLEEIAQTAGFTRGAIYKNFKSKDDLLLAVVDWYAELDLEAFEQRIGSDPNATVEERASAGADVFGSFMGRDPNLMLLMLELRLHALRNPEFRDRLAERDRGQHERVARFIEDQARQAGVALGVPADDLAALLIPAAQGFMEAVALRPSEKDRYDRVARLLFQMIDAIAVSAPERPAPERPPSARRRR